MTSADGATRYARNFTLTNERAVIGRVVFLDRGQVGVVREVAPPRDYLVATYERRGHAGQAPVEVTVAWGLKGEKVQSIPANWLGDYDLHLAHQQDLMKKLTARRGKYPGALPFDD